MAGSDAKKWVKATTAKAEDAGWVVEKTSGGHWKFVPADRSKDIVIVAATTSDYRSIANAESRLRRSGLDI